MCRHGSILQSTIHAFRLDFNRLFEGLVSSLAKTPSVWSARLEGRRGVGFLEFARSHRMTDGTRKQDDPNQSDEEAALSARLKNLGDRLNKVSHAEESSAPRQSTDMSGFARGF